MNPIWLIFFRWVETTNYRLTFWTQRSPNWKGTSSSIHLHEFWVPCSRVYHWRLILRDHSRKQSVSLFQWRCLCCTAIMTSSWWKPTGGEGGESPKNWNAAVLLRLWMFSRVRKANKLRFSRYNFGRVILIQEVYEPTNKWVYGSTHAQLYKHGIRFWHPYSSCVLGLGAAGFGFV